MFIQYFRLVAVRIGRWGDYVLNQRIAKPFNSVRQASSDVLRYLQMAFGA